MIKYLQTNVTLNENKDNVNIHFKEVNKPNFTISRVDNLEELVDISTIYKVISPELCELTATSNFVDVKNNIRNSFNDFVDDKYINVKGTSIWGNYPKIEDNGTLNNPCSFLNSDENLDLINSHSFVIKISKNYNFKTFSHEGELILSNVAFYIDSSEPFDFYMLIPEGSKYVGYVPPDYEKLYDKYDKNYNKMKIINNNTKTYFKRYEDVSNTITIPINTNINEDARSIGAVIDFYNLRNVNVADMNEESSMNICIVQYDENNDLCCTDIYENVIISGNDDLNFRINILDKTKSIKVMFLDNIVNLKPILPYKIIEL